MKEVTILLDADKHGFFHDLGQTLMLNYSLLTSNRCCTPIGRLDDCSSFSCVFGCDRSAPVQAIDFCSVLGLLHKTDEFELY